MAAFDRSLKSKKLVFLDLDGTIYLGDILIPGADAFLSYLRENRIAHYFLSNNSSKSKLDYVKKLRRMEIPASEDQMILSTDGAIAFLRENRIRQVYAVGTASMKQMFYAAGIEAESSEPEYIILGYDTELTYEKLRQAALFMLRGVELIATHCDLVCPTPEGPVPDAGSMLALFEKATKKKSFKIFGKPNPEMILHVLQRHNVSPQEIILIGDRIYTDMAMASRVGCDFILVLSGETTAEEAEALENPPALIINSVAELLESS